MLILGIETSCDETSASIVKDGKTILSNIIISQDEIHAPFGGIVPELASRKQLQSIGWVVREAINRAEATGQATKEAVEASMRAFEEAIGVTEEVSESTEVTETAEVTEVTEAAEKEVAEVAGGKEDETAEASLKAFEEAIGRVEATTIKAKSKSSKAKDKAKIEARLDFLAKMYETKKNEQSREETEVVDEEGVEG